MADGLQQIAQNVTVPEDNQYSQATQGISSSFSMPGTSEAAKQSKSVRLPA